MDLRRAPTLCCLAGILLVSMGLAGCSTAVKETPKTITEDQQAKISYFQVDPATAGSVTGTVRFNGKKPVRSPINMSGDPACVEAHKGKAFDESVVVNPNGTLANVFVYVKSGLDGKKFPVPATPVTIDQRGCWFRPRVMGIQTGQILSVVNSDPVTHNIHPLATINREWNHSQGSGDSPLARKFLKPEVMIRVKCNIHSWMHAYIGVLDNPYFAVTGADGRFDIPNLPPGNYVIEAVQEKLGSQDQTVAVGRAAKIKTDFAFRGK